MPFPGDRSTISEAQVRLTALFVFLRALTFLLFPYWWIALFLTIDFFLRGFGIGAYSPLNFLSGRLQKLFAFSPKQIALAPKIFAARIGFGLSASLLILSLSGLTLTGYVFASLLLLFSFFESVIGFCAGCYVYAIVKKIFCTDHFKG